MDESAQGRLVQKEGRERYGLKKRREEERKPRTLSMKFQRSDIETVVGQRCADTAMTKTLLVVADH